MHLVLPGTGLVFTLHLPPCLQIRPVLVQPWRCIQELVSGHPPWHFYKGFVALEEQISSVPWHLTLLIIALGFQETSSNLCFKKAVLRDQCWCYPVLPKRPAAQELNTKVVRFLCGDECSWEGSSLARRSWILMPLNSTRCCSCFWWRRFVDIFVKCFSRCASCFHVDFISIPCFVFQNTDRWCFAIGGCDLKRTWIWYIAVSWMLWHNHFEGDWWAITGCRWDPLWGSDGRVSPKNCIAIRSVSHCRGIPRDKEAEAKLTPFFRVPELSILLSLQLKCLESGHVYFFRLAMPIISAICFQVNGFSLWGSLCKDLKWFNEPGVSECLMIEVFHKGGDLAMKDSTPNVPTLGFGFFWSLQKNFGQNLQKSGWSWSNS